jgi:hypothetical protein
MAIQHEIAAVKKSAAKREKSVAEVIGTASVGDVVRQGDLYLACLARVPVGDRAKTNQLAPGETQGQQHVAIGECVVYQADAGEVAAAINRAVNGASVPSELIGPVIHCIGSTTITHPEHGWKVLPAESVWAVVYQRQFAEEIRRVQD